MPAESLWVRQEVSELSAEWLFFLSADARCAWQMLKAHVKSNAVSQKAPNRALRLKPSVAAHQWRVSKDGVEELEIAALEAGTLCIDGDCWVVTDRQAFQSARTTERLSDKPPQTYANGHIEPQTSAQDDKRTNACHVTGSGSGTDSVSSAKASETGTGKPDPAQVEREPNHAWDPAARVLYQVAERCEWDYPDDGDVQRHLKPGADLPRLINRHGEDLTIDLFVWAHENWSHPPTWPSVKAQENQILDQMNGRRAGALAAKKDSDAEPRKPQDGRDFKAMMARRAELDALEKDSRFAEWLKSARERDVIVQIDIETGLPWDEAKWRRRKWPDRPEHD